MGATETPTPRIGATDPALPQGDPGNLATWRELLNNRRYLRGSAWGTLEGEDRVLVGGNAAAPSLAYGTIEACAVRDASGQWWPLNASAASHAPGALTASTLHYLYLGADTSGAGSFSVSTTPPTGLFRASGSQLLRCLGAFATGLLGFPIPLVFGQRSGRYITSSGRAEIVALDNGRATAWAAVSLATLVPPWATTAWVMCRVYKAAADTGARELQVRRSSADGSGYLVAATVVSIDAGGAPVDTFIEQLVQVPLINQSFEYQLSASVTASDPYGARFIVAGWD